MVRFKKRPLPMDRETFDVDWVGGLSKRRLSHAREAVKLARRMEGLESVEL
jgi:hypothetical protein